MQKTLKILDYYRDFSSLLKCDNLFLYNIIVILKSVLLSAIVLAANWLLQEYCISSMIKPIKITLSTIQDKTIRHYTILWAAIVVYVAEQEAFFNLQSRLATPTIPFNNGLIDLNLLWSLHAIKLKALFNQQSTSATPTLIYNRLINPDLHWLLTILVK